MTIFFLAELAAIDPTTSSILGLVGSLGSAGAAVVVVWMFLTAWRQNAEKQDVRYEELIKSIASRYDELIKSIESRCERQDTRYESLVRDLKDVIKENSAALQQFMRLPAQGGQPK